MAAALGMLTITYHESLLPIKGSAAEVCDLIPHASRINRLVDAVCAAMGPSRPYDTP